METMEDRQDMANPSRGTLSEREIQAIELGLRHTLPPAYQRDALERLSRWEAFCRGLGDRWKKQSHEVKRMRDDGRPIGEEQLD